MAVATTRRYADAVAGVLEGTAANGELARSLQSRGMNVSSARVLGLTVTDVTPQARSPVCITVFGAVLSVMAQ